MGLAQTLAALPVVPSPLGDALRAVPFNKKRPDARLELAFELLSSAGAAVLVCDDDPSEMDEAEGTWVEVAPGQYRLPEEEFDLGAVLDWLAEGNWTLVGFSDAKAVRELEPVDLFAAPEASVEALRAAGAVWALDVFHDDGEWRVARVG